MSKDPVQAMKETVKTFVSHVEQAQSLDEIGGIVEHLRQQVIFLKTRKPNTKTQDFEVDKLI